MSNLYFTNDRRICAAKDTVHQHNFTQTNKQTHMNRPIIAELQSSNNKSLRFNTDEISKRHRMFIRPIN